MSLLRGWRVVQRRILRLPTEEAALQRVILLLRRERRAVSRAFVDGLLHGVQSIFKAVNLQAAISSSAVIRMNHRGSRQTKISRPGIKLIAKERRLIRIEPVLTAVFVHGGSICRLARAATMRHAVTTPSLVQ